MAESSSWDDWERVIRDPASGPLDVLKAVGVYQRYLAAIEQAAAKAARADGNTWEEIGDAIGVTRQSAWQRLRTLKAPDLQELLLARGQQENLSGLALHTARQMASRFQPPASVRESARGPVSYVVVSLDDVPVCALWAGSDKREAGVVPARGHEREAQQWWWLLLSATSEDFHATDFVEFWAREGRAGYAVSEVHDAASVESLRARMRDIAA